MMKRFSYILVLFISLFVVSTVVKADVTCPAKGDMDHGYVFADNGTLVQVLNKDGSLLSDLREGTSEYYSEFKTVNFDTTSDLPATFRDSSIYIFTEDDCPTKASDIEEIKAYRPVLVHTNPDVYSSVGVTVIKSTEAYRNRVINLKYVVCDGDKLNYVYVFSKSTGLALGYYNKSDLSLVGTFVSDDSVKITSSNMCPVTNSEIKVRKFEPEEDCVTYRKWIFFTEEKCYAPGTLRDTYVIKFTNEYNMRLKPSEYGEGCAANVTYDSCRNDKTYSCVWVDRDTGKISTNPKKGYCNSDTLQYVKCGDAFDIPTYLPRIISFAINLLKIMTPIILVFVSAISLLKAITASKEDEINKAKNMMVKRIGIAALVFFTITITQFVISKVAEPEETAGVKSCFACFINNQCNTSKYYKNNLDGEYTCYYVNGSGSFKCD